MTLSTDRRNESAEPHRFGSCPRGLAITHVSLSPRLRKNRAQSNLLHMYVAHLALNDPRSAAPKIANQRQLVHNRNSGTRKPPSPNRWIRVPEQLGIPRAFRHRQSIKMNLSVVHKHRDICLLTHSKLKKVGHSMEIVIIIRHETAIFE